MESPNWLNTEFLAAAISDGQDNVHVLEYDVTPAVPEGNNYLGFLHRVKLNYKNRNKETVESTSLIVKSPVTSGMMKNVCDKLNTTTREVEMYNVLLPQINRYLGEYTVSPKKYLSLRNDVLVLEDLNHRGYVMMDRIKQLDHEHCISVMRALARFHASSVALHEANPELVEKVGKEFLFAEDTGMREEQSKYIKYYYTNIANGLKTVKAYKMYGGMMLKEMDTAWDKLVKLFSKEKHFRVLNHGDLWTTNILFKHDEHGVVSDVKLIDFQMCRYASLGVDIQYFLHSSADADVRGNGFGDLLDEYRKTLNAVLQTLNCKTRLSAEELEEEVRSSEPYAIFMVCTLLPFLMATPENQLIPLDIREVLESHDPKINSFPQINYNDRYLQLVVECLTSLEKKGYFI